MLLGWTFIVTLTKLQLQKYSDNKEATVFHFLYLLVWILVRVLSKNVETNFTEGPLQLFELKCTIICWTEVIKIIIINVIMIIGHYFHAMITFLIYKVSFVLNWIWNLECGLGPIFVSLDPRPLVGKGPIRSIQ